MLYHYKRFMREWLSGRASASQADGREFESRFPLQSKIRLSNRKRIRNLLFLILFLFSALFSFRSYPRMSEFRDARFFARYSVASLLPNLVSRSCHNFARRIAKGSETSCFCSFFFSLLSSPSALILFRSAAR